MVWNSTEPFIQLYPETEAFLISAYTSDGVADEAIRSGILRVFRKPLDVAELIRTIDEALRRLLVLVVDDDKAFACELQETLHQHGYRVGVASTEDDALRGICIRRRTTRCCWTSTASM